MNWSQADAYCRWAGLRLPTEAQWEKAARGIPLPIYAYPWGNAAPICAWANFYDFNNGTYCVGDTKPVDSYNPAGASPYGALNMAGNVFEWVNDWYDSSFYSSPSAGTNPVGSASGSEKVARGGSWRDSQWVARAAFRGYFAPDVALNWLGFRCVRPLEAEGVGF